jgi:hypothetical protein
LRHSCEHVLCLWPTQARGTNHRRHRAHRRREVLPALSIADCRLQSTPLSRSRRPRALTLAAGEYLPRTPCGSAPVRSNSRPDLRGARVDLYAARRHRAAVITAKWISIPPRGGSHSARR